MKSTLKTRIIDKHGRNLFIKNKSLDTDLRSFAFQCYLKKHMNLTGQSFQICKPIAIKSTGTEYSLEYEYLNERDWVINELDADILGKYAARLHNFCSAHEYNINLPVKTQVIGMAFWNDVQDSIEKEVALGLRKTIFKTLDPHDKNQPMIPLHRDLKLQNIVYDGIDFNLIDFDFAAIDDVSIELASFIIDIYYRTRDISIVKKMIKSYKRESLLKINWHTVINNYLIYLCCNTFPFYMQGQLNKQDFQELVTERNDKLNFTYIFKKTLDESLQK